MRICVYCASSSTVAEKYRAVAREVGQLIVAGGHTLIYGGGDTGLMGVVAETVRAGGGYIVGVIPHALRDLEVAYAGCDELILTQSMHERKSEMEERAEAFIILPGGIGTIEECCEALSLKQLRYHDKALVIVNVGGYFDPLIAQIERAIAEGLARPPLRQLYHLAIGPPDAFAYIQSYQPSGISVNALAPGLEGRAAN